MRGGKLQVVALDGLFRMASVLACVALFPYLAVGQPPPIKQSVAGVTMMPDDPLALVYPKERSELYGLSFFAARFSRNGESLAVVLTGIRTGDLDQVWVYTLATRGLAPVTKLEPLTHLRDMAWAQDGTLYISAIRFFPVFFAATPEKTQEIAEPPAEIGEIFKQASKQFHIGCCEERNDRFAVKVTTRGHNYHTLSIRKLTSNTWVAITDGGPELATFLFDHARSEVLFPDIGKIVAVDLRTLRRRTLLALNQPVFPLLLDQTMDRKIVAYVEPGGCLSNSQARSWQPPRICFIELK